MYGYYNPGSCPADIWALKKEEDRPNYSTRTLYHYQEPIYIYYFYKNIAKETTTSDPTGQANVSNVVKWVQYRAK